MLKYERLEKIEEYVNRNKYVTIHELAEVFGMSRATIRRDLEQLGESHRVQLTRGGVISNKKTVAEEPSYTEKVAANRDEKVRIAHAARKLIGSGVTVFMDSGTTTREVGALLGDASNIKLVTNDLMIASELTGVEGVEVTVVGGALRRGYFTLTGHYAEQMIGEIRADLTLVGMDSVALESGCMISNMDEVGLKRAMIRSARRAVVLCDHTKFEALSFVEVCRADQVDLIITGRELSPHIRAAFTEKGIKIQLV